MLQCVAVCCSELQYVSVCCSVLQKNRRAKACCSVLQYVVVCCSVLQYVSVFFSVFQCVAGKPMSEGLLQHVAGMLQYVAVCCSMLQHVAACYSMLQCGNFFSHVSRCAVEKK